ncbi:hypothetical protein G9464_19190 [Halostella sp. JP-L12]|uniref:integrin alpha n=1 Tax=Halostella TaxID=1843185 RepID=UPI0013CEA7B2|nr:MULTISPECIES: integrin alpha [Halostella]NHN49698.1 hypothetical protein [Halostella sp. JP-L12]
MGPQTDRWLRAGIAAIALLVAGSIAVAGIGVGDVATATVEFDGQAAGVQETDDERNLSTANASYAGADENDTAGWSVAEAGDVNGDGETDFLVGAPRRHDESSGSGSAYLFYGPVEDREFDVSDADVTFEGSERADRAGVSVAGGDVDGDGYADVVIGAPHANSSDRYAGAVYVVPGGDDLNETVTLGDEGLTLEGEGWGDHAGYAVDVVNDTTGAGSDLVVGAPYNDSVNRTAGAAYVLPGGDLDSNGADALSLSDVGTKYAGEGYGDRAGWSVADAGDVNGDGLRDVIVGAYGNDTGASDAGAAYVIYGSNEVRESDGSLADADAKLVGAGDDDNAGYAVDGAGDVNGDGHADVIVGAPYSDAAADDAGAAYVLHGGDLADQTSLADANLTLNGAAEDDLAGFAVGGGPCDGRVFVGAPGTDEATGAAHVVGADATGTASLADATATLTGEARGDGAGFSLAGATNLSGEGAQALLVGAPYSDSNANDSGTAYLVGGVCPTDDATGDEPIDTGEEPRDDERADEDAEEDEDAETTEEREDDEDDTPLPTHDDPPERPDEGDGENDTDESGDDRTNDSNDMDDTDDEADDIVGNETDDGTDEEPNETNGDDRTNETDTDDPNGTETDDGPDGTDGENETSDDESDDENQTDDSDDTDGENETDDADNVTNETGNESDGLAENGTETDDDAKSNESAVVGQFESDNETESEAPTTSIETGTTVSGEETDAETRRFEFEVEGGEAIRLTLPGGTGDVQYTLYGPDGEQIAQGAPMSDARAIGGVADASGTYYVEATAPGYDVLGQYRFRVSTSGDDAQEGNDDRASAASVSPGDSLDATLVEDDEDWYAVEFSEGQTYRAAVELTDSDTELGNNVRVEVYDESGDKVIPTATSGPGVTEKGIEHRYTAEQVVEIFDSGTYYVRVTGASEPGSFDGFEDYRLTVEGNAGDDGMDDEAADEAAGVDEPGEGNESVPEDDGTVENSTADDGENSTTADY